MKHCRAIATLAACLVLLLASSSSRAAAPELKDRQQLLDALDQKSPCCVIDARSAKHRRASPLKEAVVYRKGVQITPTGTVVVIADTDAEAMRIGHSLAQEFKPPVVLAVKGGVATWREVLGAAAAASGTGQPATFIIPTNTCQTGPPLMELRSAPKK